ncbi:biotin carboxylase N-terminal domain-containing protein [uncultured Jannaschia sp.]|uniref:acetyl-CoA carboxylase biotin carboxylase subunit n=1 Tax=uncultured Jannaschia sp. TaxID=293347 RepID=UPI0026269A0C|nr:biotin carboxylase N-terminal domain-containing protein [uncultured Jannaschia sp.]
MQSLLVANRGEIARRIIRSARELGLRTVAVYSEADSGSAHVADADTAVPIGPAPARDSYLDGARVIDAARTAGANAVHPGYGFLSENAEFAEAVEAAGLIWIGPHPDSLRAMGDKQRAREIAERAGVPVVPGSRRFAIGDIQDLDRAAAVIDYPLLVKASAGGGGIGMRRVDGPESLEKTVTATQSMAQKAFGDGTVFLERFVPKARHVEIQVFGFGDGTAIHLFERDCSVQRRFQKVIEESPAPGLPPETRDAMAEAALALCKETEYRGAGTIEFIVDADSFEFFFLEMNTRIQVEHPVTEMIVDRDLVAMQIDLARGALTGIDQAEIEMHGHAIECRLYAENPTKMFMPSPGPLDVFDLPEAGEDLRIESGYRAGDVVTTYYDPMLAKLIVHGPDRMAACEAALAALRAVRVEGIHTNRDFLIACLEDAGFRSGAVYTGFVDDNVKRLTAAKG